MSEYPKQDHSRVKRVANRASYEEAAVHAIIDDAYVAHVGFNMDGRPFVIPMLHARVGRTLYLHASVKSRFYRLLSSGQPACVTFTHVDGLVIARSAFHHSMNYRSVVAHGTCKAVGKDEKAAALKAFTNKILPGRWEECRPIYDKEIEVTGVIAMEIETAAAKVRTGDPSDDKEDYDLPIWAGVLPIERVLKEAISDPAMKQTVALPDSVKNLYEKEG